MKLKDVITTAAASDSDLQELVETQDYSAIATYLTSPGDLMPNPEPQRNVPAPISPEVILNLLDDSEWATLFGMGTFMQWSAPLLADADQPQVVRQYIREIGLALAPTMEGGDRQIVQVAQSLINSKSPLISQLVNLLHETGVVSLDTRDRIEAKLSETVLDPAYKSQVAAPSIAEANGLQSAQITSIAVQGALNTQ